MSPPIGDDKLVELLLAQRDIHVERIYSINGQVALLILTLSVTILFGAVSGIKELANVHFALDSISFWLLACGLILLVIGTVLIMLGLRDHAVRRREAASCIEGAVAKLIAANESRHSVLSELESSMGRYLVSYDAARKGRYLSIEVTKGRWRLSLYQMAFFGSALLLIAFVVIATATINGYSTSCPSAG